MVFLVGYSNGPDPCAGIRGFKENGRHLYVSDEMFDLFVRHADASTADALNLAYLTGQRPSDVLSLSIRQLVDGMLYIRQSKPDAPLRLYLIDPDTARPNELGQLVARLLVRRQELSVAHPFLLTTEKGTEFSRFVLRSRVKKSRHWQLRNCACAKERTSSRSSESFRFGTCVQRSY
jgi:integrase